ncbi:MAG: tetratricopeptide repeat protein [Pseudomonadota bacterium]
MLAPAVAQEAAQGASQKSSQEEASQEKASQEASPEEASQKIPREASPQDAPRDAEHSASDRPAADAGPPQQSLEEQVEASAAVGARDLLFGDAVAAFDAGDTGKAASIWRALADSGDPQSMENLARLLERGYGVPEDRAEAIALRRQAASLGLAEAQRGLADAYLLGVATPADAVDRAEGLKRSAETAIAWYMRAADAGDAKAKFALGVAYWRGLGVAPDEESAIAWFRRAAGAGDERAAELLAQLDDERPPAEASRDDGDGPVAIRYGARAPLAPLNAQDAEEAHDAESAEDAANERPAAPLASQRAAGSDASTTVIRYGAVAGADAEDGETAADRTRGASIEDGQPPGPSDDALAAAHRLLDRGRAVAAARIYRRLAAAGDADALYALGNLYAEGVGLRRDRIEAIRLWRDAALAGSTEAAEAIATAVPTLDDEALERLRAESEAR